MGGWEDVDECVSGNMYMFTSQKEKKEKTFKSTTHRPPDMSG